MKNKDRILRAIKTSGCKAKISKEKAVIFTESGRISMTINFLYKTINSFSSVDGEGEYSKFDSYDDVNHYMRWFLSNLKRLDMLHEVALPPEANVVRHCKGIEIHFGRVVFDLSVGIKPHFVCSSRLRMTEKVVDDVGLCMGTMSYTPQKCLGGAMDRSIAKLKEIEKNFPTLSECIGHMEKFRATIPVEVVKQNDDSLYSEKLS